MILIKVLISLFILFGAQGSLQPHSRDTVTSISGNATHLREYNATWFPSVDPRIIILEGVEIDFTNHSAEVDAAVFFLDNYNQTTLFFAYFDAKAKTDQFGNLTDVTAAAFAFAIRNYVVFEYVEGNNVTGFQNNTADAITGYYDLSSLALRWKPMEINQSTITGDGGQEFKVWSITTQTKDEVFLLRFLVSGTPISVGGVDLTPTTMKIDYQINWFTSKHVAAAWTTGPSPASAHPNAMVGMVMVAAASAEGFVAHTGGGGGGATNSSFQFQAGNFTGFFNWETMADVTVQGYQTGGAVSVDQTSVGSGSSVAEGFAAAWIARIIWFSFEGYRPSSVYWDPELGTEINNGGDQSTTTTTSGSATSTNHGSTATSGSATSNLPSSTSATSFIAGASFLAPVVALLFIATAFVI